MVRSYHRKADRPDADRPVRVRYERHEEVDAEKLAEVLIRLALRAAGEDTGTGRTGDYLRGLLAHSGRIDTEHDDHGVAGTQSLSP